MYLTKLTKGSYVSVYSRINIDEDFSLALDLDRYFEAIWGLKTPNSFKNQNIEI